MSGLVTEVSIVPQGGWHGLVRVFNANKTSWVGLAVFLLVIAIAAFAPLLTRHDPIVQNVMNQLAGPSPQHIFGTDEYGRDTWARLIYGARVSVSVGVLSQLVIALVGLPVGALAGLKGGWIDYAVMRIIDVLSSLPSMLFYVLLMVALGAGFGNLILAMTLTGWIGIARLVRGQVLSLKETDYVRAARAMGGGTRHIMRTHLLRNATTPVIVALALGIPGAMFAEAGLSFLGVGIPSPQASWGQMIGMYQPYIRTAWHLTVFPAAVLAVTMLAWFLLGDGIRDALDTSARAVVE